MDALNSTPITEDDIANYSWEITGYSNLSTVDYQYFLKLVKQATNFFKSGEMNAGVKIKNEIEALAVKYR